MKGALQIGLRAGERIYINGAVLQVDRKVRLELLNNATFLIGSHVMQLDEATTPLRQLYFLIQGMMMDPGVAESLRSAVDATINLIVMGGSSAEEIHALLQIPQLLSQGSTFAALKLVRGLMSAGVDCVVLPASGQFTKEVA